MILRAWNLFSRAGLGALVVVATSAFVAPTGDEQVLSAPDQSIASSALIQMSPFGDELDTTVDLCDDVGAIAWGLDEGRLDAERERLGLDCEQGPITGRIDLYGESTVDVAAIDVPSPPGAPAVPAIEVADHPPTAVGRSAGFFDSLLGYYSTAPVSQTEAPHRAERGAEATLSVVASSLRVEDDTMRGLVHNASTRLATSVTVSLGSNRVVLPVSVQPGETAGFALQGATGTQLSGDLPGRISVDASFHETPDYGRSIALTETFASTPERPELLVSLAVPDNVALPEALGTGFTLTDVTAVVTSLDGRGRVLDVGTVSLLGDQGPIDSPLGETNRINSPLGEANRINSPLGEANRINSPLGEANRIDSSVGAQLLRAAAPGATSVLVNVGGTPVAANTSKQAQTNLEAGAASAPYTSMAVTRGTYRGVMAGIDTLYARGNGCAAVSKPRLASVLFAIPAHELAGWQPPSPASFGRSDNMSVDPRNERLYSFGRNNGRTARAFWTPGIGIYQLDTLNLRVGAYAKANTKRATMLVGKLLLDRWCDNGTNVMRAFLSNTWHACANDACFATAGALYDAARDRLRNVEQTAGNSVTGGVKSRFCWSPDRPDVFVRCRFFDISQLQGVMNEIAPDGGAGPNPYTPLPADFVELVIPTANGPAEARVFMTDNTGYARELWAIRPLGTNPRTTLRWYSQTWSSFKKDLSVWSCRSLADTRPRCSWSTTRAR